MMKTLSAITIAILIGCAAPRGAGCSEYQLFTPSPLEGDVIPPEKGKGILVRRITIRPGDTLGGISRKTSGKASYFPQILLFNDIRNPDLIFAGRELFVPVNKKSAPLKLKAAEKKAALTALKKPAAKVKPVVEKSTKPAVAKTETGKVRSGEASKTIKDFSRQADVTDEQISYQKAVKLYHQGDYNKALAAFSQFLEQYPKSPSTPDASLYKAECLFKLSGE